MNVYKDNLLRASLVVEDAGELWLVPHDRDGWRRRLPLTMTTEARKARLRPAKGILPTDLGIPAENGLTRP